MPPESIHAASRRDKGSKATEIYKALKTEPHPDQAQGLGFRGLGFRV